MTYRAMKTTATLVLGVLAMGFWFTALYVVYHFVTKYW